MIAARSVPVLMYHHVSNSPGLVTVSPKTFAEQIRGLANAGYKTLTADQFSKFLAGNPVPDKSILITFDDGYLDNWVYAYPVLKRYNFSAIMFIVTQWIHDGPCRRYSDEHGSYNDSALPTTPDHNTCKHLISSGHSDDVIVRWSEIKAMEKDGTVEFHSHTHSHSRWDLITNDPEAKRKGLAQDLAMARTTLAAHLEGNSNHLCWPQGYFDRDYRQVAVASGFTTLYTVIPGPNQPGDDPTCIHRIVVKDKSKHWLLSRLWLYRRPGLAKFYAKQKLR